MAVTQALVNSWLCDICERECVFARESRRKQKRKQKMPEPLDSVSVSDDMTAAPSVWLCLYDEPEGSSQVCWHVEVCDRNTAQSAWESDVINSVVLDVTLTAGSAGSQMLKCSGLETVRHMYLVTNSITAVCTVKGFFKFLSVFLFKMNEIIIDENVRKFKIAFLRNNLIFLAHKQMSDGKWGWGCSTQTVRDEVLLNYCRNYVLLNNFFDFGKKSSLS